MSTTQTFDVSGRMKCVRKPATGRRLLLSLLTAPSPPPALFCPQAPPPACLYPLLPVCLPWGNFPAIPAAQSLHWSCGSSFPLARLQSMNFELLEEGRMPPWATALPCVNACCPHSPEDAQDFTSPFPQVFITGGWDEPMSTSRGRVSLVLSWEEELSGSIDVLSEPS